jgi:N-acyl-D-amino-acid deacylase
MQNTYWRFLTAFFLTSGGSLTGCSDPAQEPVRSQGGQLIENALLIDGSGNPGQAADVLIINGEIARVGDIPAISADQRIDASGLILAPGFIDSHSHHDSGLDQHPDATAAVSQGITTIVVGLDGDSLMSMEELGQLLDTTPLAVNIASYTGHGSLRSTVLEEDYERTASREEVAAMNALLESEMAAGSLGLSTGLEYDPGIYSSTEEVITLASTTSKYGGRYSSHIRSEDRQFEQAIEELLLIGREAAVPVHISHIKLATTDLWGRAASILTRLDRARAAGIDVSADIYPYTFWEATLTVLLPARDFQDLDEAQYVLDKLAPAAGLTLTQYDPDPSLAGQTVAQIAAARGKPQADTLLELINDAYPQLSLGGVMDADSYRESVMGVSMTEADIASLLAWPHTNICSDGGIDGHPRGFGAFPRAINQYVKQQEVVSLEEMIRKMTSLSASHTGITGRGLVQPGYAADLVLLDLDILEDTATITQHDALSRGVVGVWVNGERVWQEATPTGRYPGQLVKRPKPND